MGQMEKFILKSPYRPAGDQPQAIDKLTHGFELGLKDQVLLGVTGSGKTFTVANVLRHLNRPTLVISHNKTLAAQLFQEYREFFPKNAVEYFVSYYDYYQPEAYLPSRDQYIEKEADINEKIDKLRLSATASLVDRRDVIVVASVSCIYGLGSPTEFGKARLVISRRERYPREDFFAALINLFYARAEFDFRRSTFRVRGDSVDVWPASDDEALRLTFGPADEVRSIHRIDPLSGEEVKSLAAAKIFPAKHYLVDRAGYDRALSQIEADLEKRYRELLKLGKALEAHRLRERTRFDLEMIRETGYCSGIENYSRYFDGRSPGQPPFTLLDFFPKDFLTVIDESHITVPQIRGMFNGDRARKETLIEYGFRLPAAADNRPLRFEEFLDRLNRTIYSSATPAEWEIKRAEASARKCQNSPPPQRGPAQAGNAKCQMPRGVVEQIVRPTGLLDPVVEVRGTKGQIIDLTKEIEDRVKLRERVLVTTLTKRLAEELAHFFSEKGLKVQYLHADVETLERTDLLDQLRRGRYDVLVGINLLREGLDLPEVSLVAILDADKEGFLRSETSLIQVMGRAARHVSGKVIMYADFLTGSMKRAIGEVRRRRRRQENYNRRHRISPQSIVKPLRKALIEREEKRPPEKDLLKVAEIYRQMSPGEARLYRTDLENKMKASAEILDFEAAARYRDLLRSIRKNG